MNFFQTSKVTQIKILLLSAVMLLSYMAAFVPLVSAAAGDSAEECRAANGTWQEKDRGGVGYECVILETPRSKSPAENACTSIGGRYDQGAGASYVCSGYDITKLTPTICTTLGNSVGNACTGVTEGGNANGAKCGSEGSFLGLPKWHKYLKKTDDCKIAKFCVLDNEASGCKTSSIPLVILALIEIALRIGSLIAVAFVVVGGFKFVTSQGEPDGVKSARNTILNALIGLVITVLATPIVSFIGNRFGG